MVIASVLALGAIATAQCAVPLGLIYNGLGYSSMD